MSYNFLNGAVLWPIQLGTTTWRPPDTIDRVEFSDVAVTYV